MSWGNDWGLAWGGTVVEPPPPPPPGSAISAEASRIALTTEVEAGDSEQDVYRKTLSTSHKIGSWLQILDEDERPLWEVSDVIDGGVSWDTSQTPERTLSVSVLDPGGRLLSGAPLEEAVEARRFVRAIYEKETARGWFRFPMFTGPLSSGVISRQGAIVSLRAGGKESLYLEPFTTWQAQHYPKRTKIVDAIHDIAAAQGERRFRLPELPDRLRKRVAIPRFTEAWPWIQRIAAKASMTAFFDGEGYLGLRPAHPKAAGWTFDTDTVLTPPEITEDYTNLINVAVTTGPDPEGPEKPLHIPYSLPPGNPFSPGAMARGGVPRRAIATDQIDRKKQADLQAHSKGMVQVPTKSASFDCLPTPHLRPGMAARIHGEFEAQPIDERFILRVGFFPLTATEPMTIGSWKPLSANWKAIHGRGGSG